MLAAGAMVASLLAVGAAPAAAIDKDSKPDHPATATACLGPALADHGFTDLGGLDAAVSDIDCLAYYGITAGRTADTFDPNSNVTRSQMALFLSRAAKVMGVDLTGGDMSADFGDIADLGEDRQAAITSLARNGILRGRGDMAFDAHGDITRTEMVVALVSLVNKVSDPVGKNAAGLFVFGDSKTLPNDRFDDAYAHTTTSDNNAISAAYELGITNGYADGTFRPSASVPRRNMATFIVRALAHSKTRPAGLTAQVSGGSITVSVRDADFAPVVNQAVDAFKTSVALESKAFKADGTCSSRTSYFDGATKCEIDGADAVTLSDGNADLAQLDATAIGKGLTVWIWTGDVGDKYGARTVAYELPVAPSDTAVHTADASKLSNDVAKGATMVHYGTTITVTIQLTGGDDDENAGPGDNNITYEVVTEVFAGHASTKANTANTKGTQTVEIGDDGSATFTVLVTDPDPKAGQHNSNTVKYTVTGDSFQPTPNIGTIVYSDEAPAVTGVTVGVSKFQSAPGANATVGSAATVTVVDQFGRPFKGAGIVITSDRPSSEMSERARITGSNGQVRIGYSYTGGASAEKLTATYGGPDGVTGEAKAYWVTAATDQTSPSETDVLSADTDRNQVVVDTVGGSVEPMSINYDGGDFFTVDGEPSTMETFEEALDKGLADKVKAAAAGDEGGPKLEWSSYVYDDPDDIASFTLTLP